MGKKKQIEARSLHIFVAIEMALIRVKNAPHIIQFFVCSITYIPYMKILADYCDNRCPMNPMIEMLK